MSRKFPTKISICVVNLKLFDLTHEKLTLSTGIYDANIYDISSRHFLSIGKIKHDSLGKKEFSDKPNKGGNINQNKS